MPIPFTISITKKILEQAKTCGQVKHQSIEDNCAIAIALQDLFPDVFVTGNLIHPFGLGQEALTGTTIPLPAIARDFIKIFDSLVAMPKVRLLIPEFDFVIFIPDEIIERINIEEDIQQTELVQMAC